MEESYETVDKQSGLTGSYEHEDCFVQTAVHWHVVILGVGMLKKISWLHDLDGQTMDLRYPALRFWNNKKRC